ncbi:MAG: isoamylase early set domain-containing protein [Anaerolineales bacterium]
MLKKQYDKSRNMYKVTFRLAKHEQPKYNISSVNLVGDFNDWSKTNMPLEPLENGDYTVTVELKPGNKHEFRYLLNQEKWYKEWEADEYILGDFGKANCVIELPEA